jgi:outer membrane protein OmpA-like peptidoglycan-associated protein
MRARAAVLLALAGGLGLSLGLQAGAATAAPPPLPVLGSTVVTADRSPDGTRATVLVNGVRRIPGATVLYFSLGIPAGSPATSWLELTHDQWGPRYPVLTMGKLRLVDVAGNRVYSVLFGPDKQALASPMPTWPGTAGRFFEFYELLPPLPSSLSSVDVLVGNNDVIGDVAVSDGVMEPAVPQTGPLPLGAGWPQIDQQAARTSLDPQQSVTPLYTETSDLDQTVVKRASAGSVSVDLSADVLFAVDSATLNPAAAARVQAAADQINSSAAAGRIQVIGHTDNTGSSSHNLDLSRRRAQAVAKALQPLVSVAGVSFVIEGHGEDEPVAGNDTSAGRRANRRVSVVFAPKEEK